MINWRGKVINCILFVRIVFCFDFFNKKKLSLPEFSFTPFGRKARLVEEIRGSSSDKSVSLVQIIEHGSVEQELNCWLVRMDLGWPLGGGTPRDYKALNRLLVVLWDRLFISV